MFGKKTTSKKSQSKSTPKISNVEEIVNVETSKPKVSKSKVEISKPKVDLSKYDNYKEYPNGTCQFDNPFTGRSVIVPLGTEICRITGKRF